MKRSFLLVAFLFISSLINAQINVDSLNTIWNKTNIADTLRLKAMDRLMEATVRNKPDSSLILAVDMLNFAIASGSKKYEGSAHFFQGRAYSYIPDYKKSLVSYEKSIAIYKDIGDQQGLAKAMAYVAGLYDYQRQYNRAIGYAIKVLTISNRIGDIERIAGVSKVLGHSYQKIGAYERAIDVYQNGLMNAEKVNDTISITFFLNAIGHLYVEQRDEEKAMDYLERSLKLSSKAQDLQTMANYYTIKGINNLYNSNNSQALEHFNNALNMYEEVNSQTGVGGSLYYIGRVHKEQQDFELAVNYFERAKQISKQTSYQEYYNELLIHEGDIKLKQKKSLEAIELCDEALNNAQSSNMIKEERDACDCLYKAYKSQNNSIIALGYHEQMTALMRRIEKENTAKNLQSLEYFRTKLKDSIAKVEKKRIEDARLAEVEAETKRRHGLQYTGIFLFVILLFILIFISGKISLSPKNALRLIFFTFLLFFEFVLVLLSPIVGIITKGEPAFILLGNAVLALLIIPIHSFFEKIVKKSVSKNINIRAK